MTKITIDITESRGVLSVQLIADRSGERNHREDYAAQVISNAVYREAELTKQFIMLQERESWSSFVI